jgi:DNA-binding transcriptional MerR regulator
VAGGRTYRAQEFARLAGVTVRALHHYDRLGLLKPQRTSSGYRVYRDRDLERLEQIVALKFIGVPLRKAKQLLERPPRLAEALRRQRTVLQEKKQLLETALRAIDEAESALSSGRQPDASLFKTIIEVMEMQQDPNWMIRYFKDEVHDKVQERQAAWTPELQARAEQDWADLFRDIRLSLNEDPGSPRAQALVDRWHTLIGAFTGGDDRLIHGVKALYADRENWPGDFQQKFAPFSDPEVWEFYSRAAAARRLRGPA